MGPHTSSSSSSISWYSDLIQWIHNNGGYIHEDLLLQQEEEEEEQDQEAVLSSNSKNSKSSSNHNIRGIWAIQDIPKGTVLIRLPIQLAVSGKSFPSIYRANSTTKIVGGVRGREEEVELERKASPWLRCVTALMSLYLNSQKSHHGNGKSNDINGNKWEFYLNSLPNDYDSILVESSWPDEDIDIFLAGTTIGSIAQKDRLSNTLRERFDLSVKPYLIANKIIGVEDDNDDDLFALFQKACACVSTRGFHLGHSNNDGRNNENVERQHHKEKEEETDSSTDDYTGPFLLPFIDLLNHTSSAHVKCTTLQRNTMARRSSNNTNTTTTSTDGSGYFSMMAERHVNKGEEILHSYGQNLTSGQLFQTFGFIEESLIRRAATITIQDVNGNSNSNSKSKMLLAQQGLTPAILSKNDILEACQYIAFSKVPQELEYQLTTTPELCDCDDFDYWDLPSPQSLKKRNEEKVIQQSIPEDFTISIHEPLPCDVVTCCCIQFLPDEVYDEMIMSCDDDDDRGEDDTTKTLSMLSPEIMLQDYFLGNLVIKTILHALERKALQYNHDMERFFFVNMNQQHNDSCDSHNDQSILWNQIHRDQCLLNHLLHSQPQQDENEKKHGIHLMPNNKNQYQHAMYGLTLRIEEMTCLYQLELQCQQWLQSFPQQQEQQQQEQQHNEDEENDTFSRPCKQIKHDSHSN